MNRHEVLLCRVAFVVAVMGLAFNLGRAFEASLHPVAAAQPQRVIIEIHKE